MDTRAAEFQKALAGMAGQQWSDIEFRCAVKALVTCGGIPAKKTINPNDFGLFAAETIALILVNDEKMIADFVERTGVPPGQRGALPRHRLAFFVKNLEPQPLRLRISRLVVASRTSNGPNAQASRAGRKDRARSGSVL